MCSSEPSTGSHIVSIDWSKCILFQKETNNTIICPVRSKHDDKEFVYHSLTSNLQRFHELESMPKAINIDILNDGLGLANILISNKAIWYSTCFNRVDYQK